MNVDIFGRCGTENCPRKESSSCFDKLKKDYYFYLSFENSNCRDYITEKFFDNGLKYGFKITMFLHKICKTVI